MKKVLAVSMVTVMISTSVLLAGCNGKKTSETTETATPKVTVPSNMNLTGFPIVKEPLQLSAMIMLSPTTPQEWNDILAWKEYEKKTGIHINWTGYPSASIVEKRNLALASNSLPDMFFRTKTSAADVDKYGAEGSFIKLNDLIDKYAPNFKAIMEKYPEIKKGAGDADGNIYSLPYLTDAPSIEINQKLFLNQEWLKKTGKKLPSTTDELYDVLVAFRDGDPNGNGKQDEVPLSADAIVNLIINLRGSFGIGNKGSGNENWDTDPKTGKLRFYPASEGYKDVLAFLNKLYTNKLIDQEVFSTTGAKILARSEQNQTGAFVFANAVSFANKNSNDFIGLDTALAGPKGDRLFTSARTKFAAKGAFMISKSNKNPEATVRWIDHFYSEEGVRLLYMGVEGVSYQKDSNGNYDFLPEIKNNIPAGSSFDQAVAKYVPYAGGSMPTMLIEKYFKGGETLPNAVAAANKLKPFVPKDVWAPFSFTADELADKAGIETDIMTLVNQRTAEFVQGKVSLDKFNEFTQQLEKMGLPKLMKIYETAYDRYKKN